MEMADEKPRANDQRFRVLELGAGTGLVSLALGKLLEVLPGWTTKRTTILATDFHPSVSYLLLGLVKVLGGRGMRGAF